MTSGTVQPLQPRASVRQPDPFSSVVLQSWSRIPDTQKQRLFALRSANVNSSGRGARGDAMPDCVLDNRLQDQVGDLSPSVSGSICIPRSEEHTSELQSLRHLVCRLLRAENKRRY